MDIKEEIDIKDNSLPEAKTWKNKPEYSNIDVKIEKDCNGASIENGLAANIKQEIDIEAIAFSNDIWLESEENSANSNEFPIQQRLEIKEEMDVKDVSLLAGTNENFLHKAEYDVIDVKIEEDFADLSEASLQNGWPDDVKQGIDITPTTLLNTPLVTHSDHYDFQCDICHKNFKQKGNLKIHLVTHSNNYDFECNICHKKYSKKKTLNKHLLMHSDDYNFKCEICHKSFKKKGTLNWHLKTLSKKCELECNICLVKFRHRGILQRHLAIHSEMNNLS